MKIHASQRRIGWDKHPLGNTIELSRFGLASGDSAATKYDYWASHEKEAPFLELEYVSRCASIRYSFPMINVGTSGRFKQNYDCTRPERQLAA